MIKSWIKKGTSTVMRRVGLTAMLSSMKKQSLNSQVEQRRLFFHYQQLRDQKAALPRFSDTGFRVYSQSDEDGLLLYIFSLIGFTNKVCVDFAFGSPYGANVTNLICNWGFTGLLVEGSDVTASQRFFDTHPDTSISPPRVVSSWITAENINSLCEENGVTGEIDLFSLDMDGNDYWMWKKLDAINPRVFVCEYINYVDKDASVTIPYKADFNRFDIDPHFFGASLPAFVALSQKKGYRLVGCNIYGFNAFFVRNDIGLDVLPEVSIDQCLNMAYAVKKRRQLAKKAGDFPWQKITSKSEG